MNIQNALSDILHSASKRHSARRSLLAACTVMVAVMMGLVLLSLLTWARPSWADSSQTPWRLQIKEAAVVQGDTVLLGEIAVPVGPIPDAAWRELSVKALWPAPKKPLRPMSISRSKLRSILPQYLESVAELCIMPGSLAIQQGGGLVLKEQIMTNIVNTMTPLAVNLGGEPEFRDFKTPKFIFLRDHTNYLEVQLAQSSLKPGRLSLRLLEKALDGSVRRKLTASVHLDLWKTVPAAQHPLNRREEITPEDITYVRKNLAFLRSDVWDGAGGPWRIKSPVGANEVIYASNLDPVPIISKGDTVRLLFRGKHIRLEVPAEAMADAAMNETVPVRNMQTNVQVYARVISPDSVQVF